MLRRDVAYFDIHNDISGNDFYDVRHRLIWETVSKIARTKQGRFDVSTVMGFLREEDGKEAVSRDYLEALIDAVADPAGVKRYAQTVVDQARTRRMIMALHESERKLLQRDPDLPLSDLAEEIHSDVLDAGRISGAEYRTLADYAEETFLRLDNIRIGRAKTDTFRWGLPAMDDACGPAIPGCFHVIGGRPEMGKTALALGVAMHLGKQAPGAIIEMEMTGDGMAGRALSRLTKIEASRITRSEIFDGDQIEKFADAVQKLRHLPIHIVAKPGLTREQIRAMVIGLARKYGCRWFILDHLQIISPSYRRQHEAEIIDRACKDQVTLAKELGAVMIALSQVNSQSRDRDYDRPQPRDLMFYNSIEPHSDLIVFPFRPEVAIAERRPPDPVIGDKKMEEAKLAWEQRLDAARGKAEIIVGKNRHGESGVARPCDWRGGTMEFAPLSFDRELARKREADPRQGWA